MCTLSTIALYCVELMCLNVLVFACTILYRNLFTEGLTPLLYSSTQEVVNLFYSSSYEVLKLFYRSSQEVLKLFYSFSQEVVKLFYISNQEVLKLFYSSSQVLKLFPGKLKRNYNQFLVTLESAHPLVIFLDYEGKAPGGFNHEVGSSLDKFNYNESFN